MSLLSLLIGKTLKIASGLLDVATSSDAGNGLSVGSDGKLFSASSTVSISSGAYDVGATTPVPSGLSLAYSTLLGCLMTWNGTTWQQAGPATNAITVNETLGTDAGIQSAIAKASKYVMAPNVFVTVQLLGQNYTLGNNYNFTKQNMSSVKITGAAVVNTTVTSYAAGSLISANKYSVTLTLASVAGMVVGGYLIVGTAPWSSLGVNATSLVGCWPITAINTSTKAVTITVSASATYQPGAAAAPTISVAAVSTTLTTNYGFTFADSSIASLGAFVLVGGTSQISNTWGLNLSGSQTYVYLAPGFGIYGFNAPLSGIINCTGGIFAQGGCQIEGVGFGIGFCGFGMWLGSGCSLNGWGSIGGSGATNNLNAGIGIMLDTGSTANWTGAGAGGVCGGAYGWYCKASTLTVLSPVGTTFNGNSSSSINITACSFTETSGTNSLSSATVIVGGSSYQN